MKISVIVGWKAGTDEATFLQWVQNNYSRPGRPLTPGSAATLLARVQGNPDTFLSARVGSEQEAEDLVRELRRLGARAGIADSRT